MKSIFKPTPYFNFYVYQIYKRYGDNACRTKVFHVVASGFCFATHYAKDQPESTSWGINDNQFSAFWTCTKRKEVASAEEKGLCEYVGDFKLTSQQVEYFKTHRDS